MDKAFLYNNYKGIEAWFMMLGILDEIITLLWWYFYEGRHTVGNQGQTQMIQMDQTDVYYFHV